MLSFSSDSSHARKTAVLTNLLSADPCTKRGILSSLIRTRPRHRHSASRIRQSARKGSSTRSTSHRKGKIRLEEGGKEDQGSWRCSQDHGISRFPPFSPSIDTFYGQGSACPPLLSCLALAECNSFLSYRTIRENARMSSRQLARH